MSWLRGDWLLDLTQASVLHRHQAAQRARRARIRGSAAHADGSIPCASGSSGDAPALSSFSAMESSVASRRALPSVRSSRCRGVSPNPFLLFALAEYRSSLKATSKSLRWIASCKGVFFSASLRWASGFAPNCSNISTAWALSELLRKFAHDEASCNGYSQPRSKQKHCAFGSALLCNSIRRAGKCAWRTLSCRECSAGQPCRLCNAAFKHGTE